MKLYYYILTVTTLALWIVKLVPLLCISSSADLVSLDIITVVRVCDGSECQGHCSERLVCVSPGLLVSRVRHAERSRGACRVITVCPAGALYSQTWRWLAAETRGTLTLTLTTSRVTSDRWPQTSSVGDICPDPCNLSSSARHPLTMSSEVR